MKHEGKEIAMKMPALNERFHASGGVCPQKVLCKEENSLHASRLTLLDK